MNLERKDAVLEEEKSGWNKDQGSAVTSFFFWKVQKFWDSEISLIFQTNFGEFFRSIFEVFQNSFHSFFDQFSNPFSDHFSFSE